MEDGCLDGRYACYVRAEDGRFLWGGVGVEVGLDVGDEFEGYEVGVVLVEGVVFVGDDGQDEDGYEGRDVAFGDETVEEGGGVYDS